MDNSSRRNVNHFHEDPLGIRTASWTISVQGSGEAVSLPVDGCFSVPLHSSDTRKPNLWNKVHLRSTAHIGRQA